MSLGLSIGIADVLLMLPLSLPDKRAVLADRVGVIRTGGHPAVRSGKEAAAGVHSAGAS
ncbi:MAG: hypothetical protein U0163_01130 [Gemmatimonadaceae bacterium]